MNKTQLNEVKRTPHFCAAPWIHLHAVPEGNVQPCCIWDYGVYMDDTDRFGNINGRTSVLDIMNHDGFKDLRKKFLNNEYEPGCTRCYDREETTDDSHSLRTWMNNTFADDEMLTNTQADDTLDYIKIKYIDIRFGNICNLKCRMCGHGLSSTWFEEEGTIADINGHSKPDTKFIHLDSYELIEPYLEYVEEIYFAGGEPLLYPEHLKMLNRLDELGRWDVKLKYNTNLTTLKYKGTDFIDVWKKFKWVHIGASIDATGDTVEYIRTKLNWDVFCANFTRIKHEAPHVSVTPSPTIGILNLEKFVEFEQFALKEDWYAATPFSLNYIMQPDYMNIYNLPLWYKQEIITQLNAHIIWCDSHGVVGYNVSKIDELITRLSQPHDEVEINRCMVALEKNLNMWDITGNLNWRTALPHIERLISTHKDSI